MQPIITKSRNTLEAECVDRLIADGYYAGIENFPPSDRRAARRRYIDQTIGKINEQVDHHNKVCEKDRKWSLFHGLTHTSIARIAEVIEHACRLKTDPRINEAQASLAIYLPDKGIYSFHKQDLMTVVADYTSASDRDIRGICTVMQNTCAPATTNQNPQLVNFKNGILDRDEGRLIPHTPDIIFTSMNAVNYNPNAENVHFTDSAGEDWDVESWIAGLADDPSVVNVIWEIIGACMRPGVRWNKTPWLYSTVGANGKGTLCELIRAIIGADNTASLSVDDFGHNFMVANILNTTCVVTDENPVGTVIDKVSTYKAAVTGDVFTIDRKYESPMSCTYNGIILQCMNSMPQVRDRSGSFYRRQLFVPMEKNFAGIDKPEIKSQFIHDDRVCEYVAKRVMDMQFDSFSSPARCEEALEEYKVNNDVAREFIYEVLPQLPWDFIPYNLIYDIYRKWADRNYRDQRQIGKRQFIADFMTALREIGGWTVPSRSAMTYTGKYDMTIPCELLYDLGVEEWQIKTANGSGAELRRKLSCIDPTKIKGRMSGIIRDEDNPFTPTDTDIDAVDDDAEEPVIELVDASVIKTSSVCVRDYKLDADDAISRRVADQLAADPDVLDVDYPLTANDVLAQPEVVCDSPDLENVLTTLGQLLNADPTVLMQAVQRASGIELTRPDTIDTVEQMNDAVSIEHGINGMPPTAITQALGAMFMGAKFFGAVNANKTQS